MSEEFREFTDTPSLTLEPFPEKGTVIQESVPSQEPAWDDTMLSAEERRMVEEFTNQIDLHNSNIVLQYGAGTQKKMADLSQSFGECTDKRFGRDRRSDYGSGDGIKRF